MIKLIYVGGVQGVGKSTSIEQAIRKLNDKYPGQVEHVKVGAFLADVTKMRFGKMPNDSTPAQLQAAMKGVVRQVRKSKARVVVLDNHFTTSNLQSTDDEHQDLNLMYPSKAKLLPLVAEFVLLEAPLSQVKAQRVAQNTGRPLGDVGIRRQIVSQRLIARLTAQERGKPLTIISNVDKGQEETVRKLREIIERHLGGI